MRHRIINQYDNFLLALGLALTFFLLFHSCTLVYDALNQKRASAGDGSAVAFQYLERDLRPQELERLAELADKQEIVCCVEGCRLNVGELGLRQPVTVYLTEKVGQGEVCPKTENSVVVGKSLKPMEHKRGDDSYLLLDGKEYLIDSRLKSSLIDDPTINLYWKNLSEEYKAALCSDLNNRDPSMENCYIELTGKKDIAPVTAEIENLFGQSVRRTDAPSSHNYMQEYENKMLLSAIAVQLVFAVGSNLLIADLWITKRKREYLICRAYGFGMIQICGRAFREAGKTAMGAYLFVILAETGIGLCTGFGKFYWERFLCGSLILFGGMVLIVGSSLFIPIFKLRKVSPTQSNIDHAGLQL